MQIYAHPTSPLNHIVDPDGFNFTPKSQINKQTAKYYSRRWRPLDVAVWWIYLYVSAQTVGAASSSFFFLSLGTWSII